MSLSPIQRDKIFSKKMEIKPQKYQWENRYIFENTFEMKLLIWYKIEILQSKMMMINLTM